MGIHKVEKVPRCAKCPFGDDPKRTMVLSPPKILISCPDVQTPFGKGCESLKDPTLSDFKVVVEKGEVILRNEKAIQKMMAEE